MIAKFFIDRPVLANVIAILIAIAGAVAIYCLPVSQYPDVVPPSVQVTAHYPGANAETIVRDVALPIEQKVNGVEGMLYMQSTAAEDGTYTLTVTFRNGVDPDQAQTLVQNRVADAAASLPDVVRSQGVETAKRSTSVLAIVALTSDRPEHDSLFLANYATINLVDQINRIPGISKAAVVGAGQYAVRIWMDPERMSARGLVPADVINAIDSQSRSTSAGQLGLPPVPKGQDFQYTLTLDSRLSDMGAFGDIIVTAGATKGGQVTRLKDIARIELGAQQYNQDFSVNGKPAAGLMLFALPGADPLDVMKQVEARMQAASRQFPAGLHYAVPFDSTRIVPAAINGAYLLLLEAGAIALIVILVFLRSWRAAFVSATTIPVTIIGTFAAVAIFGFSISLPVLLAIILSAGIVFGDTVMVVDAVARHIRTGRTLRDAAIMAMQELSGPAVGIMLVVLAVFVPAAFLPGFSGQMYKPFAVVIAAAAVIGFINVIALKPSQASLRLKPHSPTPRWNVLSRAIGTAGSAVERAYAATIRGLLRINIVIAIAALLVAGGASYLLYRVPTSFLPVEDQGYVLVSLQLPEGASLERTRTALETARKRLADVPAVENVVATSGLSALDDNAARANTGLLYVIYKDWSTRKTGENLSSLQAELEKRVANLPDGKALVLTPPAIPGIGNAAGFALQIETVDGRSDYAALQRAAALIVAKANADPAIHQAFSSFRADAPQFAVSIDRNRAETMGVDVGSAYDTVSQFIGSAYAGPVNLFGRIFQVYVQADPAKRIGLDDLQHIRVRSASGAMVALEALADIRVVAGPSLIGLHNLRPSAQITGTPAKGFSTAQAMAALEKIAAQLPPRSFATEWAGASYHETKLGSEIYLVCGLSLLLVYFVLAGLYESWLAPVPVIVTAPMSLVGTAAALLYFKGSVDFYTGIGLMLLLTLSARNAILIIDYARRLRRRGATILDAATEAARTRLRPILTTSLALVLGLVPLLLQTGAGAGAQNAIGIAIISGMTGSTILTLLFVPASFAVAQRVEEYFRKPLADAYADVAWQPEPFPEEPAPVVVVEEDRAEAAVVRAQPAPAVPEPVAETGVEEEASESAGESIPESAVEEEASPAEEKAVEDTAEEVTPSDIAEQASQEVTAEEPPPSTQVEQASSQTAVRKAIPATVTQAARLESIARELSPPSDLLDAWPEPVAQDSSAEEQVTEAPYKSTIHRHRLKPALRKHHIEALLRKNRLEAILKKQPLDGLLNRHRIKAPLMNRPRLPSESALREHRASTPLGKRGLKASLRLRRVKKAP